MKSITQIGHHNEVTDLVFTAAQQPDAASLKTDFQAPVTVLRSDYCKLAAECAALKTSREILAKNALETCNDVFSAGFRSPDLERGLMASTGNRNTYPKPIKALVDEAEKEHQTPATDAAIAEFKAQGVDALASRRKAAAYVAMDHNDKGNFEALMDESARAEMFAAELRAGVKG